jgi:peptidoglycan hydrolase-like protein with peptidoglycan-binding domain
MRAAILLFAVILGSASAGFARDAEIANDAERQKVASAQVVLHILGLYDGTTNGTLGPQTKQALSKYQRKLALPVTGEADDRTLFALANPTVVSTCLDAKRAIKECLDRASSGELASGSEAPRAQAAAPEDKSCANSSIGRDRCLEALAQINGWLRTRGTDRN